MPVKENLEHILKELPKEVTLIAVSKTKPIELIMEAYKAGHRDFGENYVQELTEKQALLPNDIRWHFIGHLQSNKVKYIAPFVHLIHGIDSLKLLKEINKEAKKNNRIISCLLQIHIADEETKFGFSIEEAEQLLKSSELTALTNTRVIGLMAMASNTADQQKIRNEFRSVMNLSAKFPDLKVRSYGMSSDYTIAIEEGSTMVRIGSSIFGERNYSK